MRSGERAKEPARRVCPICASDAAPRATNPSSPFCSPKCKLVDLGRWLDGTYRVPGPNHENGEIDGEGDR